jgi:hypothetical protein
LNYEEIKDKKPLKKGQELGEQENYVAVANENGEVYGLSPAVFYVWMMCDGKTTVEEMVSKISKDADIDAEELKEPVAYIISQLVDTGLAAIEEEAGEAPA